MILAKKKGKKPVSVQGTGHDAETEPDPSDTSDDETSEGDDGSGYDVAAGEAYDALMSKDKEAFVEAFKHAVSICMSAGDES